MHEAQEHLRRPRERHLAQDGAFLLRGVISHHPHRLEQGHGFGVDQGEGKDTVGMRVAAQLAHQGGVVVGGDVPQHVLDPLGELLEHGAHHLADRCHRGVQAKEPGAIVEARVFQGVRVPIQVPTREHGGHDTAQGMTPHEDLLPAHFRFGDHGHDDLEDVLGGQFEAELGEEGDVGVAEPSPERTSVDLLAQVVIVDGLAGRLFHGHPARLQLSLQVVGRGEILEGVGPPLHGPDLQVQPPLCLGNIHQLASEVLETVGPLQDAREHDQHGVGVLGIHELRVSGMQRGAVGRPEAQEVYVVAFRRRLTVVSRRGRIDGLLLHNHGGVHVLLAPGPLRGRMGILGNRAARLVATGTDQKGGKKERGDYIEGFSHGLPLSRPPTGNP